MPDYAIVVATRNRLDALRASIPLFLNQTRPPTHVVVVDCSDDHTSVASYLHGVAGETAAPIEVICSDKRNLPYQRNLGLERVTAPVTLFPDDDSLWFPNTADGFMTIYDSDTKGLVGGVAGISSHTSPLSEGNSPAMDHSLNRNPRVQHWRNKIEQYIAPQPFNLYAQLRIETLLPVARAQGLDKLRAVETVAGYRMSFRTHIAQEFGFDPVLGSIVGYGSHEDKDLGLRVKKAGYLLVAAPGARVFHNIHPSVRANGFSYGFFWLFNYVYICRKVFGDTPPGKRPVLHYLRYKQFLYRLRRSNPYHREIARGGAAAMAEFDRMWQAPDDRLAEVYGEVCDRVLKHA